MNVNVTDTILWQGHHDRVMQLRSKNTGWKYLKEMIELEFAFMPEFWNENKVSKDVSSSLFSAISQKVGIEPGTVLSSSRAFNDWTILILEPPAVSK